MAAIIVFIIAMLFIIGGILLAVAGEEDFGGGVFAVGLFGGVFIIFMMFIASASPGSSSGVEEISSQSLAPFEDGSYVESRLVGTDQFVTFLVEQDGTQIPMTVNLSESPTYEVSALPSAEPRLVHYYSINENTGVWPWQLVTGETTHIEIPEGAIVQK